MKEQMFQELKAQCKEVRKKYKDRPGNYYQEKIDYVEKRWKKAENYYILIAMFDSINLFDLYNRLSPECKEYYQEYFKQHLWVCKVMGV